MRLSSVLLIALALGLGNAAGATRHESPGCRASTRRLLALERRNTRPTCGHAEGCTARQQQRHARVANRIADHCVALNQIQVLGSHNSYHIQPRPALLAALYAISFDLFSAWEYTHPPLDEQFTQQGVRQIELDVFADPAGGLFAQRGALVVISEDPNSGLAELAQPGLKVLHIQDVDFETTCLTFVACLQTVKAWSDAHPRHLPLMILVEVKDDVVPDAFGVHFAVPLPFDATQLDTVDAEIRSVFPEQQLITPDDVRRGMPSLERAVLTRGWPTLAASRGKVLFTLDNGGKRDAYRAGHPALAGRVLFTNATPGDDDAAFVEQNDPLDVPGRIADLVRTGYIVRTRADADTKEARANDTAPRDAALASGAQFVSTDYPVPDPTFGTGYAVSIPDGSPARCNPVNAPRGCRSAALE